MGSKRKRQGSDIPNSAPTAKKKQKVPKNSTTSDGQPPTAVVQAPFLDDPKGPHLKREVQIYEQLSSEDESERLAAANAVVFGLLDGDGVSEPTLSRHLERRLFRGLASGRKGARLGFSIVLTEILGQLYAGKNLSEARYNGLNFERVVGILSAKTKPEGDLSGQEERDHYLGLLFGLQCFVRARILFTETSERWEQILDMLLQLAQKKSWVREECGYVIVEALTQMTQSCAEHTLSKIQEVGLAVTSEGVGIWLTAKRLFPDMAFPTKPWGMNGNPLEHLKMLAKALKESSEPTGHKNGEQAKPTGNWNPQLHFVWNLVLDQYIEDAKAAGDDAGLKFMNFWKVAVDENLFSDSASPERKFWGFSIFQKMLRDAVSYPHLLSSIFSPNLVRCLINHASKQDRFLHRAVEKSIKVLQQIAEGVPESVVTILPKLIGENGNYNFDRITKTKTIETLLSRVDGKAAEDTITILLDPAIQVKSDDEKEVDLHRQILGDYLLSMIRHINPTEESKDVDWVESVGLPSLANLAYSNNYSCIPRLSEKTRTLFRNRLASAFAHLISDVKGFYYPCKLLKAFKPDAVSMDAEISAVRDQAVSRVDKLLKSSKRANEKKKTSLQALALLYGLVIFQLYNGEPDAVSVLGDLELCYDKLRKGAAENDVEASVVLVEVLLSLISKPSLLLRKVAQHVFTAFSYEVSEEGLSLMTEVLETAEGLKGQQELFDQDDEEGDVDEDDEDSDDLDSDVEVLEMNRQNGSEDEEEDSDDEGEDEEIGEDDEEGRRLDEALAKALGTHSADQDLKEESSDSDADMSDSEMMALDTKLIEIFSQRKKQPNKKQEKKEARENIVNFKSRVLDLLSIYVKKQSANPAAFALLLPLLKTIRTTSAQTIREKAHGVIGAFAKSFKSIRSDDESQFSAAERLELLKQVHLEAAKDPAHAFAKAASTASMLIASSLYKADRDAIKEIALVYMNTQVAWTQGQVKMQASFFVDWVNWCQSHATL
ncbi:MAG: DNA-directed DNA polymerase [Claussenomyces sp. TS43310]|nr:MAG: DNA-directed DNA polymerase [Claussenomyces sp. TS43310]